jgi:hypothetical protein
MYSIKRAVSIRAYDLYVNGIHVLRGKKYEIEQFVESNVKPLGLVCSN